jgi:hypothetical protein
MSKIAFFRQQRVDGAIRCGIMVDDELVFHALENENVANPDPVLLWFVGIAVEGDDLPDEPEAARHWLIERGPAISELLMKEGQSISAGIDHPSWPRVNYVPLPACERLLRIHYAAMERVAASEMGVHLQEVAREFESVVQSLPRWEAVAATL